MSGCMSSKKYPLRGCYFEWGKQPYGVLSPSPNLPLKERVGEFRSLRRATRALPLTRKPLKRLERNFNPVRAGCVVRESDTFAGTRSCARLRMRGAIVGSSYATEAAISGVSRRNMGQFAKPAPGGKCQRGLPARRKMPAGAPRPHARTTFSKSYASCTVTFCVCCTMIQTNIRTYCS